MSKTFYITTPIYYPNAEPHLGHVYTTLCADTVARYHRLAGDDTFFLTGTDEHGIKMVKTAESQNTTPEALADRNVAIFQGLWKELEITNDDYIRTTSARHKAGVSAIVRKMVEQGDIYLGGYEGWYDEGQEEFVTETEAKANDHKSAITGRPLTRYKEESYFFRLKKYVPKVLEHIQTHGDFIEPESRRNEVISKLNAGVEDLSISRATLKWGIPLPHDPKHVIYVWIDALSNYITALGYGQGDDSRYRRYWPGVQLIGKEILWFHTVYWPAMLLSIGEPLPQQVFAHGWWTAEGRKMSKTLGNFIDLAKLRGIIAAYSQDALRYYVLRAAPFGNDLDWTDADFARAYKELKDVLGNGLNRTLKMLNNYRGGAVPAAGALEDIDRNLLAQIERLPDELAKAYAKSELQTCALLPIELARTVNGYIDATAPFKLAKDTSQAARLDTILNLCAQGISGALLALLPILPHKAAAGLEQLGIDPGGKPLLERLLKSPLVAGAKVGQGQPLFPRVEAPTADKPAV